MAEPIVFVSRHAIKEGQLEAFREAYATGARFIETEKPDTVAFLAYLDVDESEVSTIHVFPDATAMDRHFEGVEERSERAADFLEFREFCVYGAPSGEAMTILEQATADGASLTVSPNWVSGYLRLESSRPPD